MTEIYDKIASLREKFVQITYGLIKDKNEVDEVVQELMLCFLQMNKDTLKKIYKQDGEKGLIRYGCVVIKRSLRSKHSPYYYKYKKYYTKLDDLSSVITYEVTETGELSNAKNLYNIPNEEVNYQYKKLEDIDKELDHIYWYERELFKLYYYENNTYDSIAEKTGIGRSSLFNTINYVRKKIKSKLSE
jgi:RNA polymerase sigma factor (sigma-70 family)